MNDPLLLWTSLVLAIALLAALTIHTPSTFLLDLIRRLFNHDQPVRQ
jgi:hypothetical protein